jgi:hypothetical protein
LMLKTNHYHHDFFFLSIIIYFKPKFILIEVPQIIYRLLV